MPAAHWAQGLIEEFPDANPERGEVRVLFPCAEQAPSTIPEGLREKGWEVRPVEAYRTVALPPPDPERLGRVAHADAVTFTATSSVQAYVALKGPDGAPLPVPPLVVCIGPTTAQRARALGMTGVEEAHGTSTEGIVAALIHRLAGSHPTGP